MRTEDVDNHILIIDHSDLKTCCNIDLIQLIGAQVIDSKNQLLPLNVETNHCIIW